MKPAFDALQRAGVRTLPLLAAILVSCTETVSPPGYHVPALAILAGAAPVTQAVYTTVPVAPVVLVTDETGTPMGDVRVLFVVTAGGGSVIDEQVLTGSDGVATPASWRFGTRPGPQELTAAVVSTTVEARVTFTGTALVGSVVELRVSPEQVTMRPTFTAQAAADAFDAFGNPNGTGVAAVWESRDAAVATIDAGGLITGVGIGATWIVGSYLGATDSLLATVGMHPTGTNVTMADVGGLPFGVAAAPNDRIYVSNYSQLRLDRFQLPSSTPGPIVALGSETLDVAFSPSGDVAYAGTLAAGLKVVDAATNIVLRAVTGLGQVFRVAVTPDGAFVYATTDDGKVHRINTVTDAVTTLTVGGTLNGLQMNAARGVAYVSSTDGWIREIDLATFAVTRSLNIGGTPQGIDVSPSGDKIYLANEGTGLETFDAASFSLIDTRSAYAGAFDVAVTPDGQQVYVSRYYPGNIGVMDATTLAHVLFIPAPNARRLAVSADGLTVIATSEGGIIRFIR